MNNKRRASLDDAIALLERAASIVETSRDEEQDCLDNLPENLLESERASAMEDAVDELNEAIDHIGEAIENIDQAKN